MSVIKPIQAIGFTHSNQTSPSGLVGNLHTFQCGSREFDSCQSRIFYILASVAEIVST